MFRKQSRALRQISIFRNAAETTLGRAAALSRWQRHAQAAMILSYQDASTDIFFIIEGSVRAIIYAPDGKALLFRDIGKNEIFGEIAAIDRGPRSASIETLQPTLLAVMSAADFDRVLRQDAEVASAPCGCSPAASGYYQSASMSSGRSPCRTASMPNFSVWPKHPAADKERSPCPPRQLWLKSPTASARIARPCHANSAASARSALSRAKAAYCASL